MSGETAAEDRAGSVDRFTTDRLEAERVRESHLADLLKMDRDPRIMDNVGGVRTEDETRAYLRTNLDHWEQNGFGLWMLRLREDGSFVGRAYLRHLRLDGNDEIAIGYALMPEHWGKGLATEIAGAIVKLAFEKLGFEDIVVGALPGNVASQRVIEKVGGRFELETTYKDTLHVFYRIVRHSVP